MEVCEGLLYFYFDDGQVSHPFQNCAMCQSHLVLVGVNRIHIHKVLNFFDE